MSTEIRLIIWSSPDDDNTSSKEVDYSERAKEKMKEIIDIAVSGEGLENVRTKLENIELLHTFASYCFISFTTYINHLYKLILITNL